MKKLVALIVVIGFALVVTGCATPQPSIYAYPAQGQSAERVARDQNECQAWAKQQTGFDPGTDTAKGAGVGLLVGALGGAAAGAAIGAATARINPNEIGRIFPVKDFFCSSFLSFIQCR